MSSEIEQVSLMRKWRLSSGEARLVISFRNSHHEYLSYDQVREIAWPNAGFSSLIAGKISVLRKKLAEQKIAIVNVREMGYSIDRKYFALIDAASGRAQEQ